MIIKKPTLPTSLLSAFVMFFIALFATSPTFAAVVNVTGSTNWTSITTGSGIGGNPSANDTVIITGNNTILSINTNNAICKSLVIGDGNTQTIELLVKAATMLTVTDGIISDNLGTSKISFASTGVLVANGFDGDNFLLSPGSGEIRMTGGNLPAGVAEYYKLTIKAPDATDVINLTSDITVKNILEFNKGILSLGDYDLTMSTLSHATSAYRGSENSYAQINGAGRLIRSTASTAMLYPVGATYYSPVFLSTSPTTAVFSVGVRDGIKDYMYADMTDHVVHSTWEITPSKNVTDVNLSLRWNAAQNATDYDEYDSYVVMRTESPASTDWSQITLSNIGGTSQSAEASSMASGSTYLFGVGDGQARFTPVPLPVDFISFTVAKQGDHAALNFSTAWEVNNAGFEAERSTNGISWTKIGFVAGKGTSTEISNYTFVTSLANINSPVVYYRLKQVDFNGQFEYSSARTLRLDAAAAKVTSVYPNPATSKISINLEGLAAGEMAKISIMDMSGKIVLSANQIIKEGNFTLDLNIDNLTRGNYIVNIASSSANYNTKLVKF